MRKYIAEYYFRYSVRLDLMAEKMDKCISCLKENMQTLFTFVGVLIGEFDFWTS